MSYGFTMRFIEVDKPSMFDVASQIVQVIMEHAEESIRDASFYVPSQRFWKIEDKRALRLLDESWLYSHYNIPFVYWEDKNLLALVGDGYPSVLDKKFECKNVYFQNSCDQNYDYKEWAGIASFGKIVEAAKRMSASDLSSQFDGREKREIASDLAYWRRSYAYKQIFDVLDLDNWLYGHRGKFQRFCLNGVDCEETRWDLVRLLHGIYPIDEKEPLAK